MSNEEIVLKMLVHRLEQLLEAHEDLRNKWSAEITEVILLGKGVLIATPEHRTPDGMWVLEMDDEQVERLTDVLTRNAYVEDWRQSYWTPLVEQLSRMVPEAEEPQEDDHYYGDDDLIEDEPAAAPEAPEPPRDLPLGDWRRFRIPQTFIPGVPPIPTPEMPNEQG